MSIVDPTSELEQLKRKFSKLQRQYLSHTHQLAKAVIGVRGLFTDTLHDKSDFEFTLALDGTFLTLSDSFTNVYGITEFSQPSLITIVHETHSRVISRLIKNRFAHLREARRILVPTTTCDNTTLWVEVELSPIGSPPSGINGRAWAITEDVVHVLLGRYKRAVEGGRIAIWERDLDSTRLFTSPAWNQMVGLPADHQVSFADFVKCIHPDDRNNVLLAVEAGIASSEYACTYRMLDQGGHPVNVTARAAVYRMGKRRFLSGVNTDITDATKQRGLLHDVVKNDTSMIFVKDYEHRFLLMNPAVETFYNVKLTEAKGKTDQEVFIDRQFGPTADQLERFWVDDEHVLQALPTDPPLVREENIRGADGIVRWYRTTKVKMEYNGKPQVLGISVEITPIIQDRDILQKILDASSDVMYFKDKEGRFTHVNRAMVNLLGKKSASDIIGHTARELVPAKAADEIEAHDRQVLSGEEEVTCHQELPDYSTGGVRTVLSTKRPVRAAPHIFNTDVGIIGVDVDLTEQSRKRGAEEKRRGIHDLYFKSREIDTTTCHGHVISLPHHENIGGDFYVVEEVANTLSMVLIGDAEHHGVNAALLSLPLYATFKNIRQFSNTGSPQYVIEQLHRIAYEMQLNATALCFCMLNAGDRWYLTGSSAGHPKITIRRLDGTIHVFPETDDKHDPDNPVNSGSLGLTERPLVVVGRIEVSVGDLIVAYTDGLADAWGVRMGQSGIQRALLGQSGIQRALLERENCDPKEIAQHILESAEIAAGGHLDDDATVIVIRVGMRKKGV